MGGRKSKKQTHIAITVWMALLALLSLLIYLEFA